MVLTATQKNASTSGGHVRGHHTREADVVHQVRNAHMPAGAAQFTNREASAAVVSTALGGGACAGKETAHWTVWRFREGYVEVSDARRGGQRSTRRGELQGQGVCPGAVDAGSGCSFWMAQLD